MMIIKTLLLIGVLFTASGAWATDRYASPSGSGSTCSSGTPCSLSTAMSQAVAGDHVILKNGTYSRSGNLTVRSGTSGNPITIRAENKRQATILFNQSSANTARIVGITHSHIVFKDFVVNGNGWSWDGIWINCSSSSPCSNITIENNRVTNTGGKAIGAHHFASNIVIRYNELDAIDPAGNATYTGNNTPFYLGSGAPLNGSDLVSNVEIYGNIVTLQVQTTGENLMDLKENTRDFHVHHNIFQGLINGNDGCIALKNIDHTFEDNIIKDSECGSAVFADLAVFGNHIVRRNVVRDMNDTPSRSDSLIWYHPSKGQAASQFVNNTGCSIISTVIEASGGGGSATPSGLTISGNNMTASAGTCNTEEARIISEVAQPPMIADCEIGNLAADKIVCTWINNKFPPLASITNGLFSATVDTGGGPISRTITQSVINGQNTEHTLASAVSAGNTVRITGTAGAVVNSGTVGGTWISDLAASESFTNQVVTNNVGGGGAYDLSQNEFRFHHLRGTEAAPLCLHLDNCASSTDQNALRPKGAKYRVRIGLHCDETGDCPSVNVRLRYSYNEGAFTELTESFVNGIRAYGSNDSFGDIPTHGSATTELLTSQETTNIACAVVRDAVAIPNVNLSQDSETECEWVIEHDETPSVGDTYDFEVYDDQGNPVHNSADPIVRPRFTIKHYYASGGF